MLVLFKIIILCGCVFLMFFYSNMLVYYDNIIILYYCYIIIASYVEGRAVAAFLWKMQ